MPLFPSRLGVHTSITGVDSGLVLSHEQGWPGSYLLSCPVLSFYPVLSCPVLSCPFILSCPSWRIRIHSSYFDLYNRQKRKRILWGRGGVTAKRSAPRRGYYETNAATAKRKRMLLVITGGYSETKKNRTERNKMERNESPRDRKEQNGKD